MQVRFQLASFCQNPAVQAIVGLFLRCYIECMHRILLLRDLRIASLCELAGLRFFRSLQGGPPMGGPVQGPHSNIYVRGLADEVRQWIERAALGEGETYFRERKWSWSARTCPK